MIQRSSMVAATGMFKALQAGTLKLEGSSRYLEGDCVVATTRESFDYFKKLDCGEYEGDLDPRPGVIQDVSETGTLYRSDSEGVHKLKRSIATEAVFQGTAESGSLEETCFYMVDGNVESVSKSFITVEHDRILTGRVNVDLTGRIAIESSEADRQGTGYVLQEWVLLD